MSAPENDIGKISKITLNRGDTGLGFNIRGGIDNPHIPGDTGIFVTKIRENGAAFKDGRLKEGDKILEINGNNLVGVTHEDAVQCFTKARESVTLKVLHGAQDAILKQRDLEKAKKKANKVAVASNNKVYLVGGVGLIAVIVAGLFLYKRLAPSRFTSYR